VKVDGHRLAGMDAYGEHLLIDAANGDSGEPESRRVSKQEHCYDCDTPIVTGTIDGRAPYACHRCQPEWAG
jgi:endonuclease VIII